MLETIGLVSRRKACDEPDGIHSLPLTGNQVAGLTVPR